MLFSLFFFSAEDLGGGGGCYQFLLDAARFADRNGFDGVWTPERHFHQFGGLYPEPAVLSAALALATERLHIRAGSVVLPLHNTLRVAESWAVVDNLSHGRVGVSLAPGYHPKDFVLHPQLYRSRRQAFWREAEVLRRLWRGEIISLPNGEGTIVDVRTFPRPVQQELPIWITAADSEDTFARAGALGLNVLTALVTQSIEQLVHKVTLYRRARTAHGFDAATGRVTLMLHTLMGEDPVQVRITARPALMNYLRTNLDFLKPLAAERDIDPRRASAADEEALLEFAFERYLTKSALIGTPDTCTPFIERLERIGVNEIGCFIDFGVDSNVVLDSLSLLNELRMRFGAKRPEGANA